MKVTGSDSRCCSGRADECRLDAGDYRVTTHDTITIYMIITLHRSTVILSKIAPPGLKTKVITSK